MCCFKRCVFNNEISILCENTIEGSWEGDFLIPFGNRAVQNEGVSREVLVMVLATYYIIINIILTLRQCLPLRSNAAPPIFERGPLYVVRMQLDYSTLYARVFSSVSYL